MGSATVASRRHIEQLPTTFRPRLFHSDQLLGRWSAAMGSITVLSTAHIPATLGIHANTMALAKPPEGKAERLAIFLHDRHPRTAHSPKPTQLA